MENSIENNPILGDMSQEHLTESKYNVGHLLILSTEKGKKCLYTYMIIVTHH